MRQDAFVAASLIRRDCRWRCLGPLMRCVLVLCLASIGNAGDLAFRRHVVSEDSEYSAVAVLDVNHDGSPDILCGGFWYEAPSWKRHFVRNVEHIRGRFDGYAHLALDVNGDGWTDVITVNYRSRSIKWVEHPGAELGPWSIHTVEEPGSMETGRLFDVDGDGRLDVLPNGQRFAAWWAVKPAKTPVWTRHELPREVAGHGMGFGDVDGDGRGDVIGPLGWAAAPDDARSDRWVWHRDFDLGRASVPIIVADVDEDGDNDLIWSRAHGFGLFWMEQTDAGGTRSWSHHTIDASWSQCHSPLWTDMDGDGQEELVAGKRYMAHEGRDPGAYDPLVSYRYQFSTRTRTWKRWPISVGEHVGFGLDPKIVDLDADGDPDLVVCGRSGLYWLENLGPTVNHLARPVPEYEDHTDLTVVNATGAIKPIETPFDWGLRRSHVIASVQQVVGSLPQPIDRVPLDVRVLRESKVEDLIFQIVSYQAAPQRRVTAEIWLPKTASSRAPGLIVTSGVRAPSNKTSTEVTSEIPRELARRGFVCIAPEFSIEDADGGPRSGSTKGDITMRHIWDCMRAADLLEALPQVDGDRMGCLGQGWGSRLALFTAALDQRMKATLCRGFPIHEGDADGNPTLAEMIAATAPRSLSFQVAPSTSVTESVRGAVERSVPVFAHYATGQPPTVTNGELSDDARRRAIRWLDDHLNRSGRSRSRQ